MLTDVKIPILQIDDLLIVSIQIDLNDSRALQLQHDLAAQIRHTDARGVVIDFTAVKLVDSFIARVISDIAQVTKLMGAELVVTGLSPSVAITLVELGIVLQEVKTALNLQKGIDLLRAR